MEMDIFTVPVAAALWCGLKPDEITKALSEATEEPLGKQIFTHPYIPCLKPKCMLLHLAIERGELPHSRENGAILKSGDTAAPARRYVSWQNLREYISRNFPDDRPETLFSEQERKSVIDLAEYNRMNLEYTKQQAELSRLQTELSAAKSEARDNEAAKLLLEGRIENAIDAYRTLRASSKAKIETLETEKANLTAEIETLQNAERPINDRTTLLNIISAMVEMIIDKQFMKNQSQIIDYLANECAGRGLSESNLKAKFAEANAQKKSN